MSNANEPLTKQEHEDLFALAMRGAFNFKECIEEGTLKDQGYDDNDVAYIKSLVERSESTLQRFEMRYNELHGKADQDKGKECQ